MAVTLRVEDTSTTVDLSAAYKPRGYTPKPAPDYEEWTSETGTFEFDTALGTITTAVQDLGRLFIKAREWNTKRVGEPVYVKLKLQDGDDLYRSELATGLVSPRDGVLDYPATNAPYMLFDISWTRKNYWEHDTEQTLPAHGFNIVAGTARIYNSYNVTSYTDEGIGTAGGGTVFAGTLLNTPVEAYLNPPVVNYNVGGALSGTFVAGTGATSGGTIGGGSVQSGTINYHTGVWSITFTAAPTGTITADYDAGYGNYIDIAGTAIDGDLPSPLIIDMGINLRHNHFYIGGIYGSNSTWVNQFEAETYMDTGGGTKTASSNASGGTVVRHEAGTVQTSVLKIDSNLFTFENEYFVPIIRFDGTPASTGGTFSVYNVYWEERVHNYGELYRTDKLQSESLLTISGTPYRSALHKLPQINYLGNNFHPIDEGYGSPSPTWYLYTQEINSAVAGTMDIDFVQFMPTRAGYLEVHTLETVGPGGLIIDGVNGRVLSDYLNLIYDVPFSYGFIESYPSQNLRFYILTSDSNNWNHDINDWEGIIVKYRPRKRSL